MYKYFFFFFLVLNSFQCFAQDDCVHECSKVKHITNLPTIEYVQNNSLNYYDLYYQKLDLNIESNTSNINGYALLRAKITKATDSFTIELKENAVIDSIYFNGLKTLNFTRQADHIYIKNGSLMPIGTIITAYYFYSVAPQTNFAVFAGNTGGNTYLSSLSESYQARDWYPAKQVLNDKIDSSDFFITTSSTNKAASNGLLKNTVVLSTGKTRYEWKTVYPMAYYLLAFSVGNFVEYKNYAKPVALVNDSIMVLNFIQNQTTLNANLTNISRTANFIESMSNNYGLYPFYKEKYGHMYGNIGGGMEHQTISTMSSYGAGLIAHELGHQWWGDNVTCAKWNDIWVNEGFASYSELLAIENHPSFFTGTTTSILNSWHNSVKSSPTGSVYVSDANVYNEGAIFSSRLSYNKGGSIIHTLRGEINNDAQFFNVLKTYQTQYSGKTATGLDFKAIAEQVTGKNFTNFFNEWYFGQGYPTYNIVYTRFADSMKIDLNQTTSAPSITPNFSGALQLKFANNSGVDSLIRLQTQPLASQSFKIKYSGSPTNLIIDPNNFIINNDGSITVSINNVTAQEVGFRLLENPAKNNIVAIFKSNTIKNINIIDAVGRLIKTIGINSNQTNINIDMTQQKGIYFLQGITTKGQKFQIKSLVN